MSKLSHQLEAKSLEFVLLDEFVEVHAKQFEGDADVASEGEVFEHVDDVHRVVLVLFLEMLEDADLFLRLPVEPLLVPHHLQRHVLVAPVVVRLHHLQCTITKMLGRCRTTNLQDPVLAVARKLLADYNRHDI